MADDIERVLRLVGDLVEATGRDLKAWQQRRDANWPTAGRAGLVSLDAAIGHLERLRADVVPALLADDPRQRVRHLDLPSGVPWWAEQGSGAGLPVDRHPEADQ